MSRPPRDPELEPEVKYTTQTTRWLWNRLERRARRWGMSKMGTLRKAIWLLCHVGDAMDEGGKLVIREQDGSEETIILPPC